MQFHGQPRLSIQPKSKWPGLLRFQACIPGLGLASCLLEFGNDGSGCRQGRAVVCNDPWKLRYAASPLKKERAPGLHGSHNAALGVIQLRKATPTR
jgi:hypothetical protein